MTNPFEMNMLKAIQDGTSEYKNKANPCKRSVKYISMEVKDVTHHWAGQEIIVIRDMNGKIF